MLIESHLHVECFSEWRDLEGIAATWDSILQVSNPCVGVFSNLDFCRAWWKAYGANRQLFCLVCKAGSEVVAIAPLYRDRKAGKWILRIIGADSDDVDGFDFIVKRGFEDKAVDALIQKLLQMRGEWSRLELNSIPSESPGLASTRTICMARGLVIQETLVSHRLINLGSSWDEYTRQLSSKMRFSLSHQPRALARKYRLTFRRSRSVTEALEWLGVLASWQQARWNTKPAGSKLEEENRQRFYAELVCSLERNHSLSFWALYADEQLAALELGCTSGRRYLGIHQAFRPDLTASSPNLVLRAFLMQHLIEHGFEQYDFGAGDETYKVRLSNELRHYSNFCCAPRWSRSGVHIMLSNSCDSARQTLKRTLPPAAVRLARSIRKRVNDILQINMHKGAN